MSDLFYTDLLQFGKTRAFTRLAHRDRIRDFKRRQYHLATIGTGFLFLFVISDHAWFLAPFSALTFQTATDECRRMRACGRYWQCKRSIEVIGT